ncbi:hypothetical protein Leryth_015215 [Lithospermum erythrorhizon]|nr:hypothetical protein Leryth_015215 [Lithospermum erythrorhizon]
MSCNGCRALRRGCSEGCILRPCLVWINNPKAQANATLFVSKFFGRTDLMAFISAVPLDKRPALFQSLLYEACGRTVNPVNGALGLLSTGNWHVCQEAVEIILAGGVLRPITTGVSGGGWLFPKVNPYDDQVIQETEPSSDGLISVAPPKKSPFTAASSSSSDDVAGDFEGTYKCFGNSRVGGVEPKLLNLFY